MSTTWRVPLLKLTALVTSRIMKVPEMKPRVIGPCTADARQDDGPPGGGEKVAAPLREGKLPLVEFWEIVNVTFVFTPPLGNPMPVKIPSHWPVTSPTRAALNGLVLTPQVLVPDKASPVAETEAVAVIDRAPFPALKLTVLPVTLP
jgi:hypothetical protein